MEQKQAHLYLNNRLRKVMDRVAHEEASKLTELRKQPKPKNMRGQTNIRLSDEEVLEVRRLYMATSISIPDLAIKFNVPVSYMNKVCHYDTRAHLDPKLAKYQKA